MTAVRARALAPKRLPKRSWRLLARALKHTVLRDGSENGCCSCGAPTHDWVYFGACGYGPDEPDWAQCDACHWDRSVLGANTRALPHERRAS